MHRPAADRLEHRGRQELARVCLPPTTTPPSATPYRHSGVTVQSAFADSPGHRMPALSLQLPLLTNAMRLCIMYGCDPHSRTTPIPKYAFTLNYGAGVRAGPHVCAMGMECGRPASCCNVSSNVTMSTPCPPAPTAGRSTRIVDPSALCPCGTQSCG